MKNYPKGRGAWSHDHFLKFWDPLHKYVTGKASNFKFGIRIDFSKSHLTDEKYPTGSVVRFKGQIFKFWDPLPKNMERVKLKISSLVYG